MIPRIDMAALIDPSAPKHAAMKQAVNEAATGIGFLTVENTGITAERVEEVLSLYHAFFMLPDAEKSKVDMATTGSNRGWGASQSEQVDPNANPDYKQVFDNGVSLEADDPVGALGLSCYAPNQWPQRPTDFEGKIRSYFEDACSVSLDLLCAIAAAIGEDAEYFRDKFTHPMALLRGNYYPSRPEWAGDKDFGIATHTDYGCLTFLATDGSPGLEVRTRGGGWEPVSAEPGVFIINFGEMLETWTEGRIKATPHRVIGTSQERISIPLFFNPSFDTNVAPRSSGKVLRAVDHLEKRYNETYVHLQEAS